MHLGQRVRDAAKLFVGLGISVIPMAAYDKKPKVKWLEFQERLTTVEEIDAWYDCNLAIVTGLISKLVVVDCESREDAMWFARERGQTPLIVKTRRGFHLYFKHTGERILNAQKLKDGTGQPRYDVRGDGGYVVAPPSYFAGYQYYFVDERIDKLLKNLPLFKPEWRPMSQGRTVENGKRLNGNVLDYIRKIQAVSGQRGHDKTWEVVNLLKDAGMDSVEALAVLVEWNERNAEPPWSLRELVHKVQDCYRSKIDDC